MDSICANCGRDIADHLTFCSDVCAEDYRSQIELPVSPNDDEMPSHRRRVQRDVSLDTVWAETRGRR